MPYKQKIFVSTIHAVIIYALMAASEYTLIPICNMIFGPRYQNGVENVIFYGFAAIVSKMIHLMMVMISLNIYLKFFSKQSGDETDSTKGLLISLIIPFSSTVQFVLLEDSFTGKTMTTKEYVIWSVAAVLLLISTIFLFYYRNYLISISRKMADLRLLSQQKQFDEQYYALVEKSNKEMQVLSHDFKNHLIQISHAANMEEVSDYVQKLYPTIQRFQSVNVSDNKTLNTIISKYNSLCAVKGIEFQYEIAAPLSFLENADLTAILSNLLDNALESAERSAAKTVSIRIFRKNENTTVVLIKNACDTAPKVVKGELASTKADNAPHGIGIKSVKQTVKRYGGFYEWEYEKEKNCFMSLISFYVD